MSNLRFVLFSPTKGYYQQQEGSYGYKFVSDIEAATSYKVEENAENEAVWICNQVADLCVMKTEIKFTEKCRTSMQTIIHGRLEKTTSALEILLSTTEEAIDKMTRLEWDVHRVKRNSLKSDKRYYENLIGVWCKAKNIGVT